MTEEQKEKLRELQRSFAEPPWKGMVAHDTDDYIDDLEKKFKELLEILLQ